jgi:CDP-diacylglycerol--serine O-phosphatidyltransferase
MDFRLKDCCTLAALGTAVYAVILAFDDNIAAASAFVILTWVFDALDGLVARLTRTGNVFGERFDDVADHVGYSVAPAFIVYAAFRGYSRPLALTLCVYIVGIGSLRLARSLTQSVSYRGYWLGLPRSAAAFMMGFFLNSQLFKVYQLWIPGAVLIGMLGALLLTYIPYRNHKAPMRGLYVVLLSLVPFVTIAAYPTGYMWDVALFFSLVYLVSPLIIVSRAERAAITAAVARAKTR